MIEQLKKAAEYSGFKIYDEKEYKRILDYQIERNQIHFVTFEQKTVGFFGWLTKNSKNGTCVFVNNMFILRKHKKEFNIFDICKFFKDKYPDIYKLEWHNQKKDKFKELILKGRS